MKTMLLIFFVANIFHQTVMAMTVPDPRFTTGVICTASDPDFRGYDYPSKVARCNRNIGFAEKAEVAKNYGNIPESEWSNYEFDHYLPLCAGGSNNIQNLWPQPIAEAKEKDVIEVQVCSALKAGKMTQSEALQKIHDWFASLKNNNHQVTPPTALDSFTPGATVAPSVFKTQNVECLEIKNNKDSEKDLEVESKLKINFDWSSDFTILNLKVYLTEKNGDHEFLDQGDKKIVGRVTKSKSGVLFNLFLYPIQNDHDRFDLYLPKNFGENKDSLQSLFKISFEDSYPRLVKLSCEIK